MIINLLVAASTNDAIGVHNKLLWHLPNDMRFFKNKSWGMPIIMGRKTFESFSGKPLPGRFNIVMTQQKNWSTPYKEVLVAHNMPQAIALAQQTGCKEAFIIGGEKIYALAMPLAQHIYLTRVHAQFEADAFFPKINTNEWQQVSCKYYDVDDKHAYAYSFEHWKRMH